MAGFGGSIKLTGESEYRQALKNCVSSLQNMSSALKTQANDFNNSDKSIKSSAQAQKQLNETIKAQQTELAKAKSLYASYQVAVQNQTTKHNLLNKEYKNAVTELERIKKASGESSNEYQKQAQVVDKLEKELIDSTEALNESKSAMAQLKTEINNSNKTINNAEKSLNDLGNEAKETGEDVKTAGDGFTVFKGILADLGSKAIQTAISGLKKLGTAVLDVGKQAVSSYANYEQLVGGVETLFKESAPIVEEYANQAYKTAGLSANEYMETVTGFSASLLQSLGQDTKKASEYANRAVIDMSDNANKMGTDMTMIQNAYQGFAKQNYTMLDNLKLGYGGTKTEMQRLIKDASQLTEVQKELGVVVDGNDMSFGNIVNAISVVQKELGIMGTTTKEASDTISGSMNSMRSAWQNLLTGIADGNQDVGPLVDNFVESVITSAKNLIPRIKEVMNGFKEVIKAVWQEVLPELEKEIPELKPLIDAFQFIIKNGPLIVSTLAGIVAGITAFKVAGMITTLITGFQTFFTTIKAGQGIMAGLNAVMSANPFGIIALAVAGVVTAFITLWNTSEGFRNFWIGLWENIKNIVSSAISTITGVFNKVIDFVKNNWQNLLLLLVNPFAGAFKLLYDNCNGFRNFVNTFVQNIIKFFTDLKNKIGEMVRNIITFFKELPYNLGVIAGQMLGTLIKFGSNALNWVKTTIPQIINNIIKFFSELPSKIWNWLVNTYNKITTFGSNVYTKATEIGQKFISNIIDFVSSLPSKLWNIFASAISKAGEFATNVGNKAKEGAKNIANNLINGISNLPSQVANVGRNIVEGLWNGIRNAGSWIRDKVGSFARGILDGMKNALGIHSPSKLFEDQVGKNIALGIGEGFTNEMGLVSKDMQSAIPTNFDTGIGFSTNGNIGGSNTANNEFNFNMMLTAFQDALSSMKIELDDEEAARFVRKTVEDTIYT